MPKTPKLLQDPRHEAPRQWSNEVLERICARYRGKVVNVSAWRDQDKAGRRYRDYFPKAEEYWLTNYKAEARGFQGDLPNEMYLDLEEPLAPELERRFDVVFNHTTLEHVFDVFTAFRNLCAMSADTVIVVVPFMQEQHGEYGDYWRFTPMCLKRLFLANGIEPVFIDCNDGARDSIYVIAVGARDAARWRSLAEDPANRLARVDSTFIGTDVIKPSAAPLRALRRIYSNLG